MLRACSITVRPPFGLVWGQVGSLQFGPPTNQQTPPTVLSHCQTATYLILLLFCSLHLQQVVDISSLFHAHSHHNRERASSPSICLTNASSYSGWGTSLRHTQSIINSQTGPRLRAHPASLPAANSPFLCQTCQTRLMPPIDHPSPFR